MVDKQSNTDHIRMTYSDENNDIHDIDVSAEVTDVDESSPDVYSITINLEDVDESEPIVLFTLGLQVLTNDDSADVTVRTTDKTTNEDKVIVSTYKCYMQQIYD